MTDTLAATIGDRIRRARTAADLTQQQVADVSGLSRSSVANVEVGRQLPPVDTLAAVAAFLKTTVAEAAVVLAELLDDVGAADESVGGGFPALAVRTAWAFMDLPARNVQRPCLLR